VALPCARKKGIEKNESFPFFWREEGGIRGGEKKKLPKPRKGGRKKIGVLISR